MRTILFNIFIISTLLLISPLTGAIDSGNHDQHSHHATTLPNDGKQWATDKPLRQSMNAIRDAVQTNLEAWHKNELNNEQVAILTQTIEENISYMIVNCKLEPEADAALHGLIGQMLQGVKHMRLNTYADDGLPKIIDALARYPDYFQHPLWQPLQSMQ